jgi:Mor family transcriptional regulator
MGMSNLEEEENIFLKNVDASPLDKKESHLRSLLLLQTNSFGGRSFYLIIACIVV